MVASRSTPSEPYSVRQVSVAGNLAIATLEALPDLSVYSTFTFKTIY